jgi:oligoendopeptidase F
MKKNSSASQVAPEKLFKIKDTWSFHGVYKGIKDPQIEADICRAEQAYIDFARTYGTPEAIHAIQTDATALRASLDAWSALYEITNVIKPLWYFQLLLDIDSENTKAQALNAKYTERIHTSANQIVFYHLALGKIEPAMQQKFLAHPELSLYVTYLTSVFDVARYNLSEKEERLLNLSSGPAHSMWVSAQKKYLTKQFVTHKKKLIPITEASSIKADLPLKERRALHTEIVTTYKKISFFAEAELNAIITHKQRVDELRGFKKPYEPTVIEYQNSIESVESLVSAVESHYKVAHEFFKLKAQALGLTHLTLADLGTKISKNKQTFPIGEGVGLVYEALKEVDPYFSDLLARFAEQGQIDFLPRAGKRNGGYCSSGIGVPTHIFLNYTSNFDSISTLAHEMGHAIHSELSKSQPVVYQEYTISVAEVASTFFENILFDYMYARSNEAEKQVMLLEHIQSNIFTIHSQIAYFNFEKALHAGIAEKGNLTAEEIAELFLGARKKVCGPAFRYSPDDGYSFVAVPHFRYFFYVYSYAYGQLIANALYAEYKRNPEFLSQIIQFLSSGGSKRPDDIFKMIGIDVTSPDFFKKGLQHISDHVAEAKKMMKRTKSK